MTIPFPIVLLMVLLLILFLWNYRVVSQYNKNKKPVPSHRIQIDRIYYINLDRRKDRNKHFLEQCKKENINMDLVERFKAIDGKTFTLTKEEEKLFVNCGYKDSPYAKNIMANQLSHYYILKDMLKHDYQYILILQDDVVFKKDFHHHLNNVLGSFPMDAEIVNIGMHKYASFSHFIPLDLENSSENKTGCKREVNNYLCEIKDHVNPCSLAYIVTKQGAINLLHYFETYGFYNETDWNYNHYLRYKNINYASSIALCTGALMGSDIFT